MPLPILSLTPGLVFNFARVDLRLWNRNDSLRQSAEIFEWRWVGFAHLTGRLLCAARYHTRSLTVSQYQPRTRCDIGQLVCDVRVHLSASCNRRRTGRVPFPTARRKLFAGGAYLNPLDLFQLACLTGRRSFPRSSASSLASNSANTSRRGRKQASFFAISMYAISSRSSASSLVVACRANQGSRLANTSFMRPIVEQWVCQVNRADRTSISQPQMIQQPRFREPRFCRLWKAVITGFASQLHIAKPLPDDALCGLNESPRVIVFALVKAKRLFVQIAEQVERLNAHVRPFNSSFKQAPKVFQSVGMDMAFRVALRVVDHVVDVFLFQARIRSEARRCKSRSLARLPF